MNLATPPQNQSRGGRSPSAASGLSISSGATEHRRAHGFPLVKNPEAADKPLYATTGDPEHPLLVKVTRRFSPPSGYHGGSHRSPSGPLMSGGPAGAGHHPPPAGSPRPKRSIGTPSRGQLPSAVPRKDEGSPVPTPPHHHHGGHQQGSSPPLRRLQSAKKLHFLVSPARDETHDDEHPSPTTKMSSPSSGAAAASALAAGPPLEGGAAAAGTPQRRGFKPPSSSPIVSRGPAASTTKRGLPSAAARPQADTVDASTSPLMMMPKGTGRLISSSPLDEAFLARARLLANVEEETRAALEQQCNEMSHDLRSAFKLESAAILSLAMAKEYERGATIRARMGDAEVAQTEWKSAAAAMLQHESFKRSLLERQEQQGLLEMYNLSMCLVRGFDRSATEMEEAHLRSRLQLQQLSEAKRITGKLEEEASVKGSRHKLKGGKGSGSFRTSSFRSTGSRDDETSLMASTVEPEAATGKNDTDESSSIHAAGRQKSDPRVAATVSMMKNRSYLQLLEQEEFCREDLVLQERGVRSSLADQESARYTEVLTLQRTIQRLEKDETRQRQMIEEAQSSMWTRRSAIMRMTLQEAAQTAFLQGEADALQREVGEWRDEDVESPEKKREKNKDREPHKSPSPPQTSPKKKTNEVSPSPKKTEGKSAAVTPPPSPAEKETRETSPSRRATTGKAPGDRKEERKRDSDYPRTDARTATPPSSARSSPSAADKQRRDTSPPSPRAPATPTRKASSLTEFEALGHYADPLDRSADEQTTTSPPRVREKVVSPARSDHHHHQQQRESPARPPWNHQAMSRTSPGGRTSPKRASSSTRRRRTEEEDREYEPPIITAKPPGTQRKLSTEETEKLVRRLSRQKKTKKATPTTMRTGTWEERAQRFGELAEGHEAGMSSPVRFEETLRGGGGATSGSSSSAQRRRESPSTAPSPPPPPRRRTVSSGSRGAGGGGDDENKPTFSVYTRNSSTNQQGSREPPKRRTTPRRATADTFQRLYSASTESRERRRSSPAAKSEPDTAEGNGVPRPSGKPTAVPRSGGGSYANPVNRRGGRQQQEPLGRSRETGARRRGGGTPSTSPSRRGESVAVSDSTSNSETPQRPSGNRTFVADSSGITDVELDAYAHASYVDVFYRQSPRWNPDISVASVSPQRPLATRSVSAGAEGRSSSNRSVSGGRHSNYTARSQGMLTRLEHEHQRAMESACIDLQQDEWRERCRINAFELEYRTMLVRENDALSPQRRSPSYEQRVATGGSGGRSPPRATRANRRGGQSNNASSSSQPREVPVRRSSPTPRGAGNRPNPPVATATTRQKKVGSTTQRQKDTGTSGSNGTGSNAENLSALDKRLLARYTSGARGGGGRR